MIQEGIYTLLSNDAGVSGLVGTRIYPNVAPQRKKGEAALMPYVVYDVIGTDPVETLAGTSAALSRATFRFTAWSRSYDTANNVVEKIRLALQQPPDDLDGLTGSETIGGVNYIDKGDRYLPPGTAGDEHGRHGVEVEYAIWYAESVP